MAKTIVLKLTEREFVALWYATPFPDEAKAAHTWKMGFKERAANRAYHAAFDKLASATVIADTAILDEPQ